MKFLTRLLVLGALVAGGLAFTAATAEAQQENATMTDAHIQRIVSNCSQANRTLTQLQANDALMRMNRGQLYDLISTKLMARLNSRLSINRLDAAKLVSVTAAYDKALTLFRSRYEVYADQLASTIEIDCKKQPVAFYDAVTKSRELRGLVHASVLDLGRYIEQYGQEFTLFRNGFLEQQSSEDKS